MKEQSVEELRNEIERLKLQKEKELLKANTLKEKEKLMSDIAMLKRAQKRPSSFKKNFLAGLKTVGKGLGYTWKGVQKASRNIEMADPDLPRTKVRRMSAISPEAQMYMKATVPKKTKMSKKKKAKQKKMMRKTIYPTKKEMVPWGLP